VHILDNETIPHMRQRRISAHT